MTRVRSRLRREVFSRTVPIPPRRRVVEARNRPMVPIEPEFSAYNTAEEPWRIARLIRTDGRVRELLRIVTPEVPEGEGSLGERIWSTHVLRLHDERGTLQAHVSAELGNSGWLAVIALALSRAWDGEDEAEVEFLVEGEPVPWPLDSILPRP